MTPKELNRAPLAALEKAYEALNIVYYDTKSVRFQDLCREGIEALRTVKLALSQDTRPESPSPAQKEEYKCGVCGTNCMPGELDIPCHLRHPHPAPVEERQKAALNALEKLWFRANRYHTEQFRNDENRKNLMHKDNEELKSAICAALQAPAVPQGVEGEAVDLLIEARAELLFGVAYEKDRQGNAIERINEALALISTNRLAGW